MPVRTTYPGVYIEEIPSGVHTITGVATSVAAFVGYTKRGEDNRAKRVTSFADFTRKFGGIARDSELSYAISHFFDNGGSTAWVVRVPRAGSGAGSVTMRDGVGAGAVPALTLTALSSGAAANGMIVDVYYDGILPTDPNGYWLRIIDPDTDTTELFRVSGERAATNYVLKVVNDRDKGSTLVRATVPNPAADSPRPAQTGTVAAAIPRNAAGELALVRPLVVAVTVTTSAVNPPEVLVQTPNITILEASDPIPTSVMALARLVERKVREVVKKALGDAVFHCEPNDNGQGLRAWVEFEPSRDPEANDLVATFQNSGNLMLDAAQANVGSYLLGVIRTVDAGAQTAVIPGVDGATLPDGTALVGDRGANPPTGVFALEQADLFNILCIPDATRPDRGDGPTPDSLGVYSAVLPYCTERRAMLVVDPPPNVNNVDAAAGWITSDLSTLGVRTNAAAYFPRLRMRDALDPNLLRTFAPSGVIAGLYARIDTTVGVWKAPAGTEAALNGVQAPEYVLTDAENGVLNPLGLNCLRSFPIYGNVSWGARTLVGADDLGDEWKYVPVRRLALFLEESLYRGTKWAVFEPNDEPLWAQLRLNVGSFMNTLFRQGAFAGRSAKEAYLVKCDRETTTQADVDRGVVNILVMFAPLKPAEFVVIRIQQMAGQLQV